MEWTTMRWVGLAGVFMAITVLSVVLAYCALRGEWSRQEAFADKVTSLGLQPSEAQFHQADQYWVGAWRGRRVIASRHSRGSVNAVGRGQILLTMHVGVLAGGHWGARLSATTPDLWGAGDGQAALANLLTPSVLALTEGIPDPDVFPTDDVVAGSFPDAVIRARWSEGWTGLGIRSRLPKHSTTEELSAVLDQMDAFASALER